MSAINKLFKRVMKFYPEKDLPDFVDVEKFKHFVRDRVIEQAYSICTEFDPKELSLEEKEMYVNSHAKKGDVYDMSTCVIMLASNIYDPHDDTYVSLVITI
jgi:hypothetical protein